MITELFRGPGGWAEGLRLLGLTDIGLEWDTAACRTAHAAGHATIQTDVAQYPTTQFVDQITGLIASPPCQAWSRAGKRGGLADQPLVHQAVHDLAHGRDTRAELLAQCKDERSLLAAEPMRWLYDLRPEWVCLEEVPDVLPLFQQIAEVLRSWGYSVWVGVVNAADYGVPQTRRRAILIASRTRAVSAPTPTHSEHGATGLFGDDLPRWITMAEALGWGYTDRPAPTVTGGGTATGGPEPFGNATRQAMRKAMNDRKHWAWRKPAPTVSGTVGHVGGKQAEGHLNLSTEEGACLQTFRPGYPFHGNKGQVSLQIGNAVPPLLAAHIVSVPTGLPVRRAEEVAA